MANFNERDGISILTGATDPDFDPLFISKINGDSGLINTPIPLSVGGSVTVAANGYVVFSDAGFTWPAPGSFVADSLIADVSDGIHTVSVSVNLQIHVPTT